MDHTNCANLGTMGSFLFNKLITSRTISLCYHSHRPETAVLRQESNSNVKLKGVFPLSSPASVLLQKEIGWYIRLFACLQAGKSGWPRQFCFQLRWSANMGL